MNNLKIKLIVGFRRDQEHSISAEEAHKAYYLFLNPEKRGVFSNGLAIIGNQIQEIVPDYHGTMGWNPSHVLDNDDWSELRSKGIERKIRDILSTAKQIASLPNTENFNKPISYFMNQTKEIEKPVDTSLLVKSMKL